MKWLWLLALSGCGFESRPPPLFTVANHDPEGSFAFLRAVWGSAPNDVFAVGEGARIIHYDGTLWTTVGGVPTFEDLIGVWGRGPGDVWAGASTPNADGGGILHFDGVSWQLEPTVVPLGLNSVWGMGDDVWAGGTNGTLYRKHGAADWLAQPPLPKNPLINDDPFQPVIESFAGTSPTSVLAAGDLLALYYFDGSSWASIFRPNDGHFFHAAAAGATRFFTGGTQYAVSRFTPPDRIDLLHEEDVLAFNLRGAWAGDDNHVVFVGELGKVLVWDGTQVRAVSSGVSEDLEAVWGADPDDLWMVGAAGLILRAQHLF